MNAPVELTAEVLAQRQREVVQALMAVLPSHCLLYREEDTVAYECDGLAAYRRLPLAVALPETESQVQRIVQICHRLDVPIVPRGAGTGLSGGANATDGAVMLDLSRMNQVLEIDQDNMTCVVQPGVVNNDLKAAVAAHGLWYPPDPASAPWSTIGGNVATNAGGLCCLKYGVTRDYVLGLRAVTGAVPGAAGGAAVSYGDVAIDTMRSIKHALDPRNLMNPGKIFAWAA